MDAVEPDAARTLRRARRVVWAFRLVFYPGAVLVAVLLLAGRSEGDVPNFFDGTTSQGASVLLQLNADGYPAHVGTSVMTRCPGGEWWVRFWPRGGFQLDDGRLTVRETTTHRYAFHEQTSRRVVALDARIDGGTVRGTVTAVEQFDGPYWGAYECRSGPVTFSARAG